MRPTTLGLTLAFLLGTFVSHCPAQPTEPPPTGSIDAYAFADEGMEVRVFVCPRGKAYWPSPLGGGLCLGTEACTGPPTGETR